MVVPAAFQQSCQELGSIPVKYVLKLGWQNDNINPIQPTPNKNTKAYDIYYILIKQNRCQPSRASSVLILLQER